MKPGGGNGQAILALLLLNHYHTRPIQVANLYACTARHLQTESIPTPHAILGLAKTGYSASD